MAMLPLANWSSALSKFPTATTVLPYCLRDISYSAQRLILSLGCVIPPLCAGYGVISAVLNPLSFHAMHCTVLYSKVKAHEDFLCGISRNEALK